MGLGRQVAAAFQTFRDFQVCPGLAGGKDSVHAYPQICKVDLGDKGAPNSRDWVILDKSVGILPEGPCCPGMGWVPLP